MTIENVLIVDTETNGLHPEHGAKVIEIGAILYNIKNRAILQCLSTLFPCESNPVQHINNITPESTKSPMVADHILMPLFLHMARESQVFVAHNAQFDKKFIDPMKFTKSWQNDPFDWICTKSGFKWPSNPSRLRLQDVCRSMGIDYAEGAHRSMYDCERIALCFSKVDDLQERIDAAYERAIK